MIRLPGGCILLARKIEQSDIWTKKPCWWLKVWEYILLKVNHKPNNMFDRGQNFFSRNEIYQNCYLKNEGIKPETTDNVLRWLKRTTQITTQKTTRGIIITVLKYSVYQSLSSYKNDTENDTKNDIKTTQTPFSNDTINKNDKNDKKYTNPTTPRKKTKYLEYVLLSVVEYNKLVEAFGKAGADDWIEQLNLYIGSHGKKYASHYMTILSWSKKEAKASKKVIPPSRPVPVTTNYGE